MINNKKLDGLIFTYDHFNPTFLKSDLVGRCRIKKNRVIQIKEKSIFNEDELTLAGVYYYSKWRDFKKYAQRTFKFQNSIDGIFYESQIYNEYIKDSKKIINFNVDKFISLGLVKNIEEYNFWNRHYQTKKEKKDMCFNHTTVIPACGEGKRFVELGYAEIKPLIKVQETTMLNATIKSLPESKKNLIIINSDHENKFSIIKKNKNIKNSKFVVLPNKTDGMARTCMAIKDLINLDEPILISSCDYSIDYDQSKFKNIIDVVDPDVIIWTFKNYPDARNNPYAYAYLEKKNGLVTNISEKIPISSSPQNDDIVQGIFYFKKASLFFDAAQIMFDKKNHVNGEYYIATAINELIEMNMKVIPFAVDQYICWGTPFDFMTFQFWEDLYKRKKRG